MKKNQSINNKILKNLGLNIKYFRKKLNLTQEQVAERIDAERSYITALENGLKSPSIYFLFKLAHSLNTSLKELLDINLDI